MKTIHKMFLSTLGAALVFCASLIYLKRTERVLKAEQKETPVLIAKKYIPTGKTVTSNDVEERLIPETYIQPMALRTLKGVVVRARRGVIKGEQITRSNVQEEGAELGLSWALSATETAASVLLPPERAAGGHLEPGDRVDVIGVFDHQPGWDEASAVVLDTGVKILAVNDRVINSPSPQGGENMKREVSNEPILVTLSVPLHGAARMALAQEKGRVFLMLTSPLETGVHSAAAVALRSLKR